MANLKLPTIKNKKKINIKEFKELAKKVRDSFEKEKEYLSENSKNNENSYPSRLL